MKISLTTNDLATISVFVFLPTASPTCRGASNHEKQKNNETAQQIYDLCCMTGTSWFFILIFAIPLIAFLIWLMKQDRRKGLWGIIIIVLLVIGAVFASIRASKNAIQNFEERKKEAQENSVATPNP